MNIPMTINAERESIRQLKSEVGKLRPLFDVVGVYLAPLAALLTGVIVALIDSLSPLGQLWGESGPLAFHRATILKVVAPCSPSGTGEIAESLAPLVSRKGLLAKVARSINRRVSFLPADLRAILGHGCAVGLDLILRATNGTGIHGVYYSTLEPKYCAVTLERMSSLGLAPELLSNVEENVEQCQTATI